MAQEIIRFLTAGNVDDGKSTLIGRLLYDTNSLYKDQIEEVIKSTEKSFKGEIDFSLFLDGLTSERAQKITIDVAYRYFSHKSQKFIIADAPGHEQYTKNMAVAASNSNIAIILIDARKGVKTQTIRHSYISHLFGIRNIIVAINKMDLVDYDQNAFEDIKKKYLKRIGNLEFDNIHFVPISAMTGENIVEKSKVIEWYDGDSIVSYLLRMDPKKADQDISRLQIQNVVKYSLSEKQEARYYQGLLSSGKLEVGQDIAIYPSEKSAKISKIIHSGKDVKSVEAESSIMVSLDYEIDLERGGLITNLEKKPYFSDNFGAYLVWFSENDFTYDLEADYVIKINHNYIRVNIDEISHLINIETLQEEKKHDVIKQNKIAYVDLSLSNNIAFDRFRINKKMGSFLLIDRSNNETLACGIIRDYKPRNVKIKKKKKSFGSELLQLIKNHLS